MVYVTFRKEHAVDHHIPQHVLMIMLNVLMRKFHARNHLTNASIRLTVKLRHLSDVSVENVSDIHYSVTPLILMDVKSV